MSSGAVPPTTLGDLQRAFVPLVATLIAWAYQQGYELTFGEAYRTPEQAAWDVEHGTGILHSLHTERLAVDLQLFKDGVYQTDSAAYEPLGVYWESLDPRCRWGGRFTKPDGNHFSLTDGSGRE